MKKSILLIVLFFCAWYAATAAETEPNNTPAQANTLALNGNNSGAISTTTDIDWFKVTTNADGQLNINFTVSNGIYMWCEIFDNNGTTSLKREYTASSYTVSRDGLAAGTYYIKLYPYYTAEKPVYSLSSSLTVPAQANDVEPNGTRAQAKVLPLNGSKTGHINYLYNSVRDTLDWYEVTTNADGRLRLTVSSANGDNVWAYLYDNDGITELAKGYTAGTENVVNRDGLAAGTYYVKIKTYYDDEFAPYTLSDSLFSPTEPNNTEPDSTRALAATLPLNGKKTGHVNYYYNNHRDSVDWYKVTTNADGRLRLTMQSGNGQNVWAYLFDNDAKTLLASGYTSGNAIVVNRDGLAAGTYYVRVNTYYTYEWAPYTLSDSLFKPAQANDAEPNNSRAEALTLPVNSSVTGHTNYYYKKVKDTADWYKLTTASDGMITINIQSHNGNNVWAYLYDNDGTTLLDSKYTAGTISYSYDGLKAGTYFVRVKTYYDNTEFAPYTLGNTVSYYTNDNDTEPNNSFSKAKTLLSNRTGTGHVNFYYNGSSDEVDYHKINYTGSGNLTLVFSQQNRFKYGSADATWFQVFKDTNAAPISTGYYYTTSGDINLTNLTQGYYYIKVFTYYTGKGLYFSSYSIKNIFTQGNKAKIVTQSYGAPTGCDSTGTITYKLSKSRAPYRVQLYRFGSPYGNQVTVNKTTVTINNLPPGVYYATVYGDGATDPAKGISDTVTFRPPVPAGLTATSIQATQARLNWTAISCADYFSIQYRVQGTATWTTKKTTGNVLFYVLKNLTALTNYEWRIAAIDTGKGMQATSAYSSIASFKTKASSLSGDDNAESISIAGNDLNVASIVVAPNPATNYFIIKYKAMVKGKVTAILFGTSGKPVWTSGALNAEALNNKQVNVSQFAGGTYFLKVTDGNGKDVGTIKIFIVK